MNVCVLSRSRSSHIDPHAYVHAPSFCIVEHGLRSRPVARLDQTPRTQSASQSTPFVVTLMPKTVARFFGKGGVDCCMMGTGMGMAGWGCTAWSFSSFISFLSSLAVIPFSESEPFPLIQQWADYGLDMPEKKATSSAGETSILRHARYAVYDGEYVGSQDHEATKGFPVTRSHQSRGFVVELPIRDLTCPPRSLPRDLIFSERARASTFGGSGL
jgi:hypothetical protein